MLKRLISGPSSVAGLALPPCLPCCFPFAVRRMRAASSPGSRFVLYWEHVLFVKRRSCRPSSFVCDRSDAMVYSVCFRSFAYACHVARSKARSRTILLCGSGSRPSRTGIQHCGHVQPLFWRPHPMNGLTWMMSSKPLAVIFFIEETLPPNFRIVPRPNVGTCRKLCAVREGEVLPSERLTVRQTPQLHLHPLHGVSGGHAC